jgi:ligand-binding sensor domain-containing protein
LLFLTLFHILIIDVTARDLPYSLDPDRELSDFILGNYRIDHGLPSNILNHIHRTKDGYIWITSYNGVIRFDGAQFTVFNSENVDVFETDAFSVFAEEENGRLLLGTYGKGVYTYKNGAFKKLGSQNFNRIIESILIDNKGKILKTILTKDIEKYLK